MEGDSEIVRLYKITWLVQVQSDRLVKKHEDEIENKKLIKNISRPNSLSNSVNLASSKTT
jgi:signal transduction histidine kinase